MKTFLDVIVSTTSTIMGWEIDNYLGFVSSHVVAGTNIFSDILAGFSDFFGGRSHSYQKQLNSINNEAIKLLKQKTLLLGGNLILGVRIDFDEISGKGKSMFMVTASGTAVKARRLVKKDTTTEVNPSFIDSNGLKDLVKRRIILSEIKNKKSFDEETLNFIIEHEIHEIGNYMLERANELLNKDNFLNDDEKMFLKKCKEFFFTLNDDKAKFILNEYIIRDEEIFNFVYDIISKRDFLDLQKILNLLNSNDLNLQKRALKLLKINKSIYTEHDIEIIEKILNKIEEVFKPKAKIIKEQSRLFPKVKEIWICECGKKNNANNVHCVFCGRDIYGFKKNEVKAKEIKKLLTYEVNILKEYFDLKQKSRK